MTSSAGWTSLLWFVAIVAAIPLALWLLRRSPMMGGGAAGGVLRSVAVLPLSATQRIVTVEVGQGESRRWLVLGVTAQSIATLHTMEPQGDAPAAPDAGAAPPGFAQMLNALRRRDGAQREGRRDGR